MRSVGYMSIISVRITRLCKKKGKVIMDVRAKMKASGMKIFYKYEHGPWWKN